jgi:2-amino-4-hydroxy-6-hydroxymethyldihydropteridine diphosphokinase
VTATVGGRDDRQSGEGERPRRTRAFLGLGSNLGDRVRYLRDAVATLGDVGLVAVSPVYETDPVGGPPGQDPYLNLVVELRTDRNPHDLLGVCRRLETAAGRVRDERWGPRTLDVDVLWVDGVTLDEPDLTVPHPRLWERRFVVAPLHDLAPDLADTAAVSRASGTVQRRGALEEL